jgi:peptide/nickel transport system permease protein
MARYIVRRLLLLIPIWIGILALTFLMRVLVPGDPVEIMFFGQQTDREVIEMIQRDLGLDRPLHEQFVLYVWGVMQGDLGTSITTQNAVWDEIKARFPYTIVLTMTSLSVAIVIGLVAGILSAVYKDSIIDAVAMIFALAGLSMPAFWLGLLLIYVFAVQLGWFPVLGEMSARGLVLPSITLGVIASAVLARIVRSSMLEVLNEDYIRSARAKGLIERTVIVRHGLKNALIPILTIIGLQFGGLLSGAFVIEVVFAWHGIGELAVIALQRRDFPLIQGVILVVATTYVLVNLLVDILYAFVDPRITYS